MKLAILVAIFCDPVPSFQRSAASPSPMASPGTSTTGRARRCRASCGGTSLRPSDATSASPAGSSASSSTIASRPQGCDASVLLSGPNSEQLEIPNQTLRPEALKLIDDIRAALHSACGPEVSCADITTLATRDAVVASGGPYFDVPLGRRDGLAPAPSDKVGDLPAPFFDVPTLISSFKNRSLDTADLVALSGAHTVGRGHCASFSDRLQPVVDPTMDPAFARKLQAKCANDSAGTATQVLDVRTPNAFDNKYYFDLIAKQGLFASDQGLMNHPATKRMATRFALNQTAFFDQFATSVVKMSQMSVLTGNQGEIRRLTCAKPNAGTSGLEAAASDRGLSADA